MKVYYVYVGMDGYLPDSGYAYPTLKEAIQGAIEEKRFSFYCGYDGKVSVRGNIRQDRRYEVYHDGDYRYSIGIDSYDEPSIKTRTELIKFCQNYCA